MLSILIFSMLTSSIFSNVQRDQYYECKKIKGADCTVFKARVMESEGNSGSAMDLYLRSGMVLDYVRLKALSGEDISADLKDKDISDVEKNYYLGLSAFAKGKWKEAVSYFSKKDILNYKDAKFNLFYSYLMLGNNDEAKNILSSDVGNQKMKALLLYAENKQYEARKIFREILKSDPSDSVSLRYIAHIYYRTGWYQSAEKIYQELISSEWRDTELYYLLAERCEMRVRYLKPELASKDADRIIKEYHDRPDFIVQWISWLLEYGYIEKAKLYVSKINISNSAYTNSLKSFAEGLLAEDSFDYEKARTFFTKADESFSADEYKFKADVIEESGVLRDKNFHQPSVDCSDYKIKNTSDGWYLIEVGPAAARYYLNENKPKPKALLKLRFVYDTDLNFTGRGLLWAKSISSVWSSPDLDVSVVEVKDMSQDSTTIEVVPWPSYFYLKRTSSHEWSVLTPYRVIAHEAGHLFGLSDEYYEPDPRIKSRNLKRYIGEPSSIMRNMLFGIPQKRHIQFILSSLQCGK